MPVTYTNRRGITYYLCRGKNKAGKPYYRFARKPLGTLVDEIPQGYRISESVNGIVSLVKDRPMQLRPTEVMSVEAEVQRHPNAHSYRAKAQHDRVVVYERVGPNPDAIIGELGQVGLLFPGKTDQLRELLERRAQFTPVLRFVLEDSERRTFRAQKKSRRSNTDKWLDVGAVGSLKELAHRLIAQLRAG